MENEQQFPDGVEISCARYKELMEFIRTTARLTKDRECHHCGLDGDDDNGQCAEHEPFDMPNDDAVETLHSLISGARELLKEETN